ncbi:potassium/proton antiporter [Muribaculaceae bacterium Isolate-007 (NCI)]|uniref:potassium/proton antiporter n=2 Tax=Muribaculum intestinale TaxID=1796646 RepID=UPI000F478356|nr:potassium/proton antiporter [Muribaculum intestinale]ROT07905.1 potassium/proton antiporter [Muribaculaceae bacterium Isolate-100 (HZI)]RXE66468.1 potassium/proton antiporter [Muribaculaceae bacterium Isolate-007 (NCI)]
MIEITSSNIMLVVAVMLMMSVFVGKAGSRFGMPALLLFLGVGMVAGVDGFGLHFDSAASAQFVGMIALSIILFTGGLETRFSDIRPVLFPGIILATVGVLLTTGLTGTFIYYVFHWLVPEYSFGWAESMLIAAIMSSTDSASVFSIFDSAKLGLKQKLRPTLELESGSNDPMAYLLVIILIGIIEGNGHHDTGAQLLLGSSATLAVQLLFGAAGGLCLGYATVWIVNRLRVDNEFLYPVMVISCVFFTFTLTEIIGGNSYLAVYIAGLVVGNKRLAVRRTIVTFFGGFTWLVQIIMFLTLGLLVNPHELLHVVVPGIALGIFIMLVARPVAVFLSLLPFRQYTFKGRVYISWVGLRGAVPIIFATYAVVSPGVEESSFIFNIVFFITILSLLLQGTTVNSMARWLGLSEPVKESAFQGIDISDDIAATTSELEITSDMLADGSTLKEIGLQSDTLAVMVRRDDRYIVPKGDTRLYMGDVLLLVSNDKCI